jgi:hypothetical protein
MMEFRDQDGTLLMAVGETGGYAFPCAPSPTHFSSSGMTLRDYFAAKAMQGIVAADSDPSPEKVGSIAEQAYILADAMLEARSA